jgi:hypothetical protein
MGEPPGPWGRHHPQGYEVLPLASPYQSGPGRVRLFRKSRDSPGMAFRLLEHPHTVVRIGFEPRIISATWILLLSLASRRPENEFEHVFRGPPLSPGRLEQTR